MLTANETGSTLDVDAQFRSDVLAGLGAPRRAIPARWLYDSRGSQLFEQITELPEYYPTRVERSVLAAHAADVAAITGTGRVVVEFGSGSSTKTPLLLAAVEPTAYVPIDISGEFLRESATALEARFPGLPIYPVEADFTLPITLPPMVGQTPRLGFFPGSTIGNLIASSAVTWLRATVATLGEDALLLIGIDRIKDIAVLRSAYDDAQSVTAAFNLNLLSRINRELCGDIPVDAFRHVIRWNDRLARIEMHLEGGRDVAFAVAGHHFTMSAGETIHTENSHKYGPRDARLLLAAGGWTPIAEWTDAEDQFALILAEATPFRSAP